MATRKYNSKIALINEQHGYTDTQATYMCHIYYMWALGRGSEVRKPARHFGRNARSRLLVLPKKLANEVSNDVVKRSALTQEQKATAFCLSSNYLDKILIKSKRTQ